MANDPIRYERFGIHPGEVSVILPDGRVRPAAAPDEEELRRLVEEEGEPAGQPAPRKSAPFRPVGLIGWPAGPDDGHVTG